MWLKSTYKKFGLGLGILLTTLLVHLGVVSFETGSVSLLASAGAFFDLNIREYASFLPGVQGENGLESTVNIVGRAFGVVRLVIGVIAILIGLLGSIRLVSSRGNEEEFQKAKDTLLYGVVGLVVIALSGDISQILSPFKGGLLGADALLEERSLIFNNSVRIVITFIKYFAGAIAVAMLIRIGFRMVALSDSEENLKEDKLNLVLISFGLFILIFGDSLVRNIFYVVDSPANPSPTVDIPGAMQEVISFINLIISIVGPLMVLTFVGGGLLYVLSGLNEEYQTKAKKMMTVSLIGMIIIYGAFAVVNTFIIGRF